MSSEKQSRGASLDVQRAAIVAYAAAQGEPDPPIHTDILSGTRDDRPAYQRMLTLLRPHDTVVVWRLDRVGRHKSELFRFFEWCKRTRVSLVSVTQPEMSNELARDLLSVIAAFESAQIAERVFPAMMRRVEEGRWPSRPPRGYVIGPDGHLAPGPDADEVRRAFALFVATGNLVGTGVAFGMRPKTLVRMIRSRVYLGELPWAGVVTKCAHPPLVPAPLWEAANAILDGRLHGTRRARPDTALLTGYLYVGGTERRLYRQPDARRGNHRYATREDGTGAPRYSVRCDAADAWVVAQLAALTFTKADRAALLREIRAAARDDPHKGARARLQRHRTSLERERDGTASMLARGQIDRARWERMDARQGRDLAAVDAQLAALPPLPDPAAASAVAALRLDLAARVHAAWEAGNVPALRLLMEAFVARVEVWTEPSTGLRGSARGYWPDHPPRFTITWVAGVEQRQ